MLQTSYQTVEIQPATNLSGRVTLPPSKSQSIRALLFSSLAVGPCQLDNLLNSPDVAATERFTQDIDAQILDVGNSGLLLRFATALAALRSKPYRITGDTSIQTQRSMHALLDALKQLGAQTESTAGFAPLTIKGPIQAGACRLDGRDSQPISALLIAASQLTGETEIFVDHPGEKGWVDLTLSWLNRFAVPVTVNSNYTHYCITGPTAIPPFTYTVPGDLSSLAFPLAAGLITHSTITIDGVDLTDPQCDRELLDHLKKMGARFQHNGNTLTLLSPVHLRGEKIDISNCVDAVCALAAVACYSKGTTEICGASITRGKECNRLACLVKELGKMGAVIEELPDGLRITGSPLHGAEVDSHGDHRMALALSVAALGASSATTIHNCSCIEKTYGSFFDQLSSLGAPPPLPLRPPLCR